jgi:hypothetical protein
LERVNAFISCYRIYRLPVAVHLCTQQKKSILIHMATMRNMCIGV